MIIAQSKLLLPWEDVDYSLVEELALCPADLAVSLAGELRTEAAGRAPLLPVNSSSLHEHFQCMTDLLSNFRLARLEM